MLKRGIVRALVGLAILQGTALGAQESCKTLANADDVLRCAVARDKSIKMMEADVRVADAGAALGAQRLNPELELESVKRERGFTHEIAVTHSFDLGGKREAKRKMAQAEKNAAMAGLRETREDVIVATVVNLYRLRQIEKELAIVQEGVETFSQVAKQFRRAGALSPEQSISISIFNMALEDNQIREAGLRGEKAETIARLSLALGQNFTADPKILPPPRREWPTVVAGTLDSASAARARAETGVARAGLAIQESEAWPDVKLGPKVEIDEDRKTWVGASLTMPLPLYHRNQGGKAQALAEVEKGVLTEERISDEAERAHASLVATYRNLSVSLTRSSKSGGVESKHTNLHALLNRGVVSAPLITELHRQRQEYYEDLHQQELKAVEALWRIYALEGRAEKESIQ